MNNTDIIVTKNIAFGCHQPIIQNMSITIQRGEFIGIFGQNGSGKSTFLKTLLGQVSPLSGEIHLFGEAPKRGNNKIGYMPQTRINSGLTHLTCNELLHVTHNGTRVGFPLLFRKNQHIIDEALGLVDATALVNRCINQLSGGELQRIHLAQALLNKPELLLLDEPLANLDPRMQDHFITILNDIRRALKVTILMTAHNPNALLNVMDRALYFGNKNAMIGATDEVITSEALTELYGTPIEVLKIRNRLLVLGEISTKESEDTHHYDK